MRNVVLPLMAAVLSCTQMSATAIQTTLEKALKDKAIIVSMRSKGGYCTQGLEVSLRNISCKEYNITVNSGLIFQPEDPSYQNLVIAGGQQIDLQPDSAQSFPVQTFCAKASASGPVQGLRYTFMKVAGSDLMQVLNYISEHNLNDYLGQHAVWCFTNDHEVNSVYDASRPETSKAFSAYVARLKGVPAPKFYTVYRTTTRDRFPVFLPDRQKVVLDIKWTEEPRNITASVYRADGTIYRKVAGTEHITKEGHRMHVEFKMGDVLPGNYTVKVRDDENYVYASQQVVIE